MRSVVRVSGNKTLGVGDDGTLQLIDAQSIIKIPNDTEHNFLIYDSIEVFRDTADSVSVRADTGVTLSATGLNISTQCGFATYVKIADNKWIGWGNLN